MMPPAASPTSANMASDCIAMMSALVCFAGYFGRVECRAEPLVVTEIFRAFPEPRPADPGRAVAAQQLAVLVLAHHLVDEDVLRDDDITFHSHHLGDVGDTARAVAQAGRLNHDVDRC